MGADAAVDVVSQRTAGWVDFDLDAPLILPSFLPISHQPKQSVKQPKIKVNPTQVLDVMGLPCTNEEIPTNNVLGGVNPSEHGCGILTIPIFTLTCKRNNKHMISFHTPLGGLRHVRRAQHSGVRLGGRRGLQLRLS